MGLGSWIERGMRKMKWYDLALIRLSAFFAALFLVAVWLQFRTFVLGFAWYWYLAIAIVLSLPMVKKFFSG